MKKLLSILTATAMTLSLAACGGTADTSASAAPAAPAAPADTSASADAVEAEVYKIGIVNYVDDPSLNQIQENIEAELEAKSAELGVTFEYESFNAQANQSTINSIASELIADQVDLIIPIATPTAMIMQNATADNQIPVVFAAVSDPVGAGLVASMDAPGSNITGSSDALDTANIFNLILAMNPDLAKVGLLFDASQDSSTQAIADAEAFLTEKGIEFVEKTGTTTDDLALAADALIDAGCTVVFTPTDNTVQVAEPSLYQKFIDGGVQHYAGADSFALVGAFCGYGVDYANLGVMTADMAVDILFNDASPAETAVQTYDNGKASVNVDTCEALGLNYDDVAAVLAPLCTTVEGLTTGTSF